MEIAGLENRLKKLTEDINKETFIYDLLLAYDFPKATISRLKSGDLNLSKDPNEILLKKKLLFKSIGNEDLHDVIDRLSNDKQIAKNEPRLIIVTDFNILLAQDTKTKDTLDVNLEDLFKHSDFFLPWLGKEKTQFKNENIVDIKAATKMGQLYDSIIHDNQDIIQTNNGKHRLNIFFARILFCLFAEDTDIFKDNLFTNQLAKLTSDDGSDLKKYLEILFESLDIKDKNKLSHNLQEYPYVNGGLFKDKLDLPYFSRKSRNIIIESGQLDWAAINPDIFGSMVQSIADPEERSNFGDHYTSVPNILKVINPLFMDELKNRFKLYKTEKELEGLLQEIYNLKIFDPACGSGNFLIVTYKQLCLLEIDILKELHKLNPNKWGNSSSGLTISGVNLNQFYGITIKDFDAEMSKLSLWLVQHQMNIVFKSVFGNARPSLPLSDAGNIKCGNSTEVDWKEICPKHTSGYVYLIGNPPYKGSGKQSQEQKSDMANVFEGIADYKNLDYISCWFYLASKYIIKSNAEFAFVSTNSITQGGQVGLLWKNILDSQLEIGFAYQSFKWTNNARSNAGVTCVIIGIRNVSKKDKFIFKDSIIEKVNYIDPYLSKDNTTVVIKRSSPLSLFPKMLYGNKPADGGYLSLDRFEKDALIEKHANSVKFIKKLCGSDEFINGKERYCIWIEDKDVEDALLIPEIKSRINAVAEFRKKSKKKATQEKASSPHSFAEARFMERNSIIIPVVSSERREYLPIGFLDNQTVILNTAQAIYDPPLFIFAIIASRLHMLWTKTVGGRLETRISYSSSLCFNTYPFPEISVNKKKELEELVYGVLNERERYPDKTIADLYDPKIMPHKLKEAHRNMDDVIEKIYEPKGFNSDEERIKCLFNLYKEMAK